VIPRSRGGGHELENLLACCAKCNSLKGAKEGVFLAQGATPPVFSEHLSLTRSETMLDSPFKIRPKPIQ
jgi:5-methylcytosine-specific restriction endonuclease McrA